MWKNPSWHHLFSAQPKALAAHKVLAHPHAAFHPFTCGLRGGAAAVAATLISYDDVEVAVGMTTRRRRAWSSTSSTPTRDYVEPLLQLFFLWSARLVVMIHSLLLASILGWHDRRSACVAYRCPIQNLPRVQVDDGPRVRYLRHVVLSYLATSRIS
jgi:hypothetical protein